MGLLWGFVLVAIAWFFASLIDGIPDLWHLTNWLPTWLVGLVVVSAIAAFISEP
ncbi:MAG: hypothetical protein AAF609_06810 [Cyanobacteria bacterium P01_C01_bin.120]